MHLESFWKCLASCGIAGIALSMSSAIFMFAQESLITWSFICCSKLAFVLGTFISATARCLHFVAEELKVRRESPDVVLHRSLLEAPSL